MAAIYRRMSGGLPALDMQRRPPSATKSSLSATNSGRGLGSSSSVAVLPPPPAAAATGTAACSSSHRHRHVTTWLSRSFLPSAARRYQVQQASRARNRSRLFIVAARSPPLPEFPHGSATKRYARFHDYCVTRSSRGTRRRVFRPLNSRRGRASHVCELLFSLPRDFDSTTIDRMRLQRRRHALNPLTRGKRWFGQLREGTFIY